MKKQEMTEIHQLQLEYIISEFSGLSEIAGCILNADYCKGCWKFRICSQVPFSKRIFKPCRALIKIEENIHELLNNYEEDSKNLYEDLLNLLCEKEEKIEELEKKIAILEKGSNDLKSKIGK